MGGINFNGVNGSNKIISVTNPATTSKINNGFNIDFSTVSSETKTVDAGEAGAMMLQMAGVQPTTLHSSTLAGMSEFGEGAPEGFMLQSLVADGYLG